MDLASHGEPVPGTRKARAGSSTWQQEWWYPPPRQAGGSETREGGLLSQLHGVLIVGKTHTAHNSNIALFGKNL